MKATIRTQLLWIFGLLLPPISTVAQTPPVIEYGGRVVVDGTNFNSTASAPGFFKCILLTRDGSTNTIWSNDGTPGNPWGSSLNGGPPNTAVELIPESESAPYVVNGQFKLRLGDDSTTPAINPSVLSDSSGNVRGEVYLRVWFSEDNNTFEQLSPDVKLASAPYAIWASIAETVKDRAITINKLADGAVIAEKLANGSILESKLAGSSVSSAKLQHESVTETNLANGSVTLEKLRSDLLDVLAPAGTIVAFGGTNIPPGWLLCDGRPAAAADYPRLFAAISTNWGAGYAWNGTAFVKTASDFNVPDLRGVFLRGLLANRTSSLNGAPELVDPDAASRTNRIPGGNVGNSVGSVQSDAFRSHYHHLAPNWEWAWGIGPNSGVYGTIVDFAASGNGHLPTTEIGSSESRPKNAYVNYIIKY